MSTKGSSTAARASEVEFHRLLDTLPMAAYACDAAGLITYFNQPAARLWNREPKLFDSADRYCGSLRLFDPEGRVVEHHDCWMALALRDGRAYEGEVIVIERCDSSRRVARAYAKPIYDDTGDLCGAVNVLIDITDQNETEGQLRSDKRALQAEVQQRRELERQLQMALDAGQMGIWEWDMVTNHVTW